MIIFPIFRNVNSSRHRECDMGLICFFFLSCLESDFGMTFERIQKVDRNRELDAVIE